MSYLLSNPMHIPIQPFERLQVSSESLIDADRWRLAHAYHRNRQNLHFQSLSQPGIVAGLGVISIAAPQHIAKSYRDERWVQIQPGLAINYQGNPIVVPEPVPVRISSEARKVAEIDVYLTLTYVDPDQLEGTTEKEFVTETFRIHERQTSLSSEEIELCRIRLKAGATTIQTAENVFEPKLDEIDLRYRSYLTRQQQRSLTVGVFEPPKRTSHQDIADLQQGINGLLKAQPGLYPELQAAVGSVETDSEAAAGLICMTGRQVQALSETSAQQLRQLVQEGSTVFIEVAISNTPVEALLAAHYQLTQALNELASIEQGSPVRMPITQVECDRLHPAITAELVAVEAELQPLMAERLNPIHSLLQPLNIQLSRWRELSYHHPLKSEPFSFDALPLINSRAIELWHAPGVVVTLGALFERWQVSLPRAREHRRAAQEMGINFLAYASCRQQLMQLQKPLI